MLPKFHKVGHFYCVSGAHNKPVVPLSNDLHRRWRAATLREETAQAVAKTSAQAKVFGDTPHAAARVLLLCADGSEPIRAARYLAGKTAETLIPTTCVFYIV